MAIERERLTRKIIGQVCSPDAQESNLIEQIEILGALYGRITLARELICALA